MSAVKEMQLVESAPEATQAIAPTGGEVTLMFERLAKDPAVDVEKLERLIAMQERILNHQAKAEFDAAFAQMQGVLPVIAENGAILVGNEVRSKYAKYEDIQAAIRPVLQAHGFSIRHRNEQLPDGKLRIVGVLSHRGGHSEQDEFICPADKSGGKQDIQAIGSTRSYGMRYTTISLLNIETRGMDDDGRSVGRPAEPAGYDNWQLDMAAAADEGLPALTAAWNKSKKEYREFAGKFDREPWERLKAKAAKVRAS